MSGKVKQGDWFEFTNGEGEMVWVEAKELYLESNLYNGDGWFGYVEAEGTVSGQAARLKMTAQEFGEMLEKYKAVRMEPPEPY